MKPGWSRISNRRLFQIHGWLGINVGLLLFIVCFSGTVATLSHEIEWLLNPAVRATPPREDAPFASWTTWHVAAQEAHPAARILSIDHPDGRRWAVRVTIAYSNTDWRFVFVDPYTAAVNGTFSEFGVVRFFRSFHKQFYIYPGSLPHGVYAVGPLGLILLLSLTTGLLFYRFRWRDLLMRGPWGSGRAFWSALHRATGMWILPMAFVITATGVWYLVERVLEDADIALPESAAIRPDAPATGEPRFWPMPIEEAVLLAERTVPGFQVTGVSISSGAASMLTLHGQTRAWLVRDAANIVRIDPHTRRVEQVRVAATLHPLERWAHTADPLHFGTFGGTATKVVWFIAGLVSSVAILLGVRVWFLRSIPAPGLASRPADVLLATVTTLIVLAVSVYGCFVNIGDALAHAPAPQFVSLGAREVGGVSTRVSAARVGTELRISAAMPHGAQRVSVRRGWAWLDGATAAHVPAGATPVRGGWEGLTARVDASRATADSYVWLAVEDIDGAQFLAGAPAGPALSDTRVILHEVVPLHVWVVIAAFTAVVALVCVGWFVWLQRQVGNATRRHASPALERPVQRHATARG